VAAMLPAEKQRYNVTVTNLDPVNKVLTLNDGKQIQYNKVENLFYFNCNI
jgi:hypothetical protein